MADAQLRCHHILHCLQSSFYALSLAIWYTTEQANSTIHRRTAPDSSIHIQSCTDPQCNMMPNRSKTSVRELYFVSSLRDGEDMTREFVQK